MNICHIRDTLRDLKLMPFECIFFSPLCSFLIYQPTGTISLEEMWSTQRFKGKLLCVKLLNARITVLFPGHALLYPSSFLLLKFNVSPTPPTSSPSPVPPKSSPFPPPSHLKKRHTIIIRRRQNKIKQKQGNQDKTNKKEKEPK